MARADTDFLKDFTNNLLKENIDDDKIADVITFTESQWGLNFKLLPAQKFILKCLYRMPLDNKDKYIPVKDMFCEETLDILTEEEFLLFLIKEGRTNIVSLEKYKESVGEKRYNEMIVCAGRRGSKCLVGDSYIYTTDGIITSNELLKRKKTNQNIGIITTDLSNGENYITNDIILEDNGLKECFRIESNSGKFEEVTYNHPFLVWRDDMIEPEFVNAEDLKVGDFVLCNKNSNIFGKNILGKNKSRLLGYLYGDGGLTNGNVKFTNKDDIVLNDFKKCLDNEFPECELNYIDKYDYMVVKKDRKKNYPNPVKEWLKDINSFNILAKNKRIPDVIMQGCKDDSVNFLNALFSCDGYVSKRKPDKDHKDYYYRINICLASKNFIYDIQKLLLCFGINGSINYVPTKNTVTGKIHDAWRYTIYDTNSIKTFCNEIGILGKNEKIIMALENHSLREEKSDLFPHGVWNRIEKFRKDNNKSLGQVYGSNNGKNGRLRRFNCLTKNKVLRCATNMNDELLLSYCKNDKIRWEKVKTIENIGIKQTVALEVKGTNIITNSMVTHNTNLSSVIASYEIYRVLKKNNPQQYYGFPESEQIFFTCASVDSEGAVDLLNKIKSRFFGCPILKDKQVGDGAEYLTLQTDHDIETYGARNGVPTIKINTGACASNGLRGKNSIMVILDEVAFFGDNENSKFSGTNVYNALTPSCASFKRKDAPISEKGDGLIVLISSPKKKSGIFWETYENSFKMSDDILMFKMYSALMNPENDSNYLRLQHKKNPEIFDIEFGANFSSKTTHFIADKSILYDCVDIDKRENPREGDVSKDYYLAVDLAYKNDATSLALVHKEDDIYHVDYVNAYFPGSSDVWSIPNSIYQNYNELAEYNTFPVDLVGEVIEDLSKRFMIKKGIYDQWSGGYPLETYLYNKGLDRIEMVGFGPNVNSLVVDLFETLLRDKKIKFWNCEPMLQEFLALEVETIRNNFRKVQAPQQDGYHDDIFDAVSRAIYLCYINTQKASKRVTLGAGNGMVGTDNSGYMISQMRKSKIHGTIATRTVSSTFGIGRGIR